MNEVTLPAFLMELSNVTVNYTDQITQSPATIYAIVEILSNVANASLSSSIILREDSTRVGDFVLTFTFSKSFCLKSTIFIFFF